MSDYPEHDKLLNISGKSQGVGEFLEWLGEAGWQRMKWGVVADSRRCLSCDRSGKRWPGSDKPCIPCKGTGYVTVEREGWVQDSRSSQTVVAEFFGIDLGKIEQEKRAMLTAMQYREKERGTP